MCPATLHHADLLIGEIVDELEKEVSRRHKIGIEDGDELALSRFHAFLQSARLEAFPVCTVMIGNRAAQLSVAFHQIAGDILRFIGGVVQDLDVEPMFRVVERADRLDQTFNYVLLVENGELYGNS